MWFTICASRAIARITMNGTITVYPLSGLARKFYDDSQSVNAG